MKPATLDILRRLEQAGPRGIHSFEFRNIGAGRVHIDAPKRVSELRELGYDIAAEHEQYNGSRGVRYVLRGSSEGSGDVTPLRREPTEGPPSPDGAPSLTGSAGATGADVSAPLAGSTSHTSDGNPARPSVKPQARAGGAERPGIDTPSRPGLASEGDGASAGGLNSPPPAAPRPTRHPAQSMKQWSTPPDDREGWGLVRDFDGRWWWEWKPPLPAQTEMAA